MSSNTVQSFSLKNQPPGNYVVNGGVGSNFGGSNGGVLGGTYGFTFSGTGSGSAQLQILGPDDVTWIAAGAALTANGSQVLSLPPGSYRVAITGFTACYVNLTRVPN